MKPVVLIGIALILLGIVALSYERITYTTKEKIIDIGPLQATAEREKSIPLPLLLGGLALVAGIGFSRLPEPSGLGPALHRSSWILRLSPANSQANVTGMIH
jgi:hypothetical protein